MKQDHGMIFAEKLMEMAIAEQDAGRLNEKIASAFIVTSICVCAHVVGLNPDDCGELIAELGQSITSKICTRLDEFKKAMEINK